MGARWPSWVRRDCRSATVGPVQVAPGAWGLCRRRGLWAELVPCPIAHGGAKFPPRAQGWAPIGFPTTGSIRREAGGRGQLRLPLLSAREGRGLSCPGDTEQTPGFLSFQPQTASTSGLEGRRIFSSSLLVGKREPWGSGWVLAGGGGAAGLASVCPSQEPRLGCSQRGTPRHSGPTHREAGNMGEHRCVPISPPPTPPAWTSPPPYKQNGIIAKSRPDFGGSRL